MIDIDYAVIGDLRVIKHIKLFGIFTPRELASIYDHSADAGSAPSNKLGHGVDYHIGTVLNGTQQNRSGHRVINHQRNTMLVRYSRKAVDIGHVARWITHTLAIDRAGILVDQLLHIFGTIAPRKTGSDSALRKDVC